MLALLFFFFKRVWLFIRVTAAVFNRKCVCTEPKIFLLVNVELDILATQRTVCEIKISSEEKTN